MAAADSHHSSPALAAGAAVVVELFHELPAPLTWLLGLLVALELAAQAVAAATRLGARLPALGAAWAWARPRRRRRRCPRRTDPDEPA